MTIEQTAVVDFVSIDPAGKVRLTISDHLEWDKNTEKHLLLLQEKLNCYLAFVESGEIVETYPDAKGKDVMITIVCKYPLNNLAQSFLDRATVAVERAGMQLNYHMLEDFE